MTDKEIMALRNLSAEVQHQRGEETLHDADGQLCSKALEVCFTIGQFQALAKAVDGLRPFVPFPQMQNCSWAVDIALFSKSDDAREQAKARRLSEIRRLFESLAHVSALSVMVYQYGLWKEQPGPGQGELDLMHRRLCGVQLSLLILARYCAECIRRSHLAPSPPEHDPSDLWRKPRTPAAA